MTSWNSTLSHGKSLGRTAGLQPSGPWVSSMPPMGRTLLQRHARIRQVSSRRTAEGARPKIKGAATRRAGSAAGNLIPAPPSEFTPKVKRLVRARAGSGDPFDALCEAGGEWLGVDGGEFQHRAARGAGGCKDAVVNGPANCCLLCPECHRRAESRDERMGMDWAGFWIEHGTTTAYDPRNVPILLASPHGSGIQVYLAADGLGPDRTGYLLQAPDGVGGQ